MPPDGRSAAGREGLNRSAKLRAITAVDLPAVAALHDAAFRALGAAYTAAHKAAHAEFVRTADYAADVLRSDVWVAERDGRLLGSAGWIHAGPGQGRLRKVFVHPEAARQGLGTRLVLAAEDRARAQGCSRFMLRAYLDAVPLYEKLGYVADRPGEMAMLDGAAMPVLFMTRANA
jgi:putative acetyltransferase